MSFAGDIGRMVLRGPQRPMTHKETEVLMSIMFISEDDTGQHVQFYKDILAQSMSLKIMDQRFRLHFPTEQQFSPKLLVWLSTLADRPGHAVLMVAALAHMREENRELSLNTLVGNYFVNGIPKDVAYQLAWDAQKVTPERVELLKIDLTGPMRPDNCLDYPEAWK